MQGKIFVLLFLLIYLFSVSVNAEIEERFKQDFFNIYKHIAIEVKELTDEHVTPDKIKYFLFNKKNPVNYTEIDPLNPEELANPNVQIVFIIHGWTENREGLWYEDLKNAFLSKPEEYYVVQVDWSEPANQIYTVSSWNTKDVGRIIGKFVVGLHKNYSIPLKNFLIVGHSLGGQIAGFIGKKVQELTGHKLPRLIALDPAGPFFVDRPDEKRLNKNDADVVQVIHTNGGTFGFEESTGTIDFYPNGGSFQPGCTRIDLLDIVSVAETLSCDHRRSYAYFIQAVLNPRQFLGTKCYDWVHFEIKLCDNVQVALGNLTTKETGDFYLETNNEKTFGRIKASTIVENVLKFAVMPLKLWGAILTHYNNKDVPKSKKVIRYTTKERNA